jgi:uncharacterized cupin superfamily protein
VLEPGKPSTMYHRESDQEDFLILQGECLLIVEGEERLLREWDLFHCAPNTRHSIVGAADPPCVILMLGARSDEGTILYPRDEAALARAAGGRVRDTVTAGRVCAVPALAPRATRTLGRVALGVKRQGRRATRDCG